MEAHVFILFDSTAHPSMSVARAEVLLRRKHPRWHFVGGGSGALMLGRYGRAPVALGISGGAGVRAECAEMAAAIAARTPAAAALAAIGHASGRIELVWNTKADPDPVPETAELILDAAQDLAAEVAGVVVIGGSRLLPATRGTEADDLRLLLP